MITVAAFDTETTGTDVETARIVSACLVFLDEQGQPLVTNNWLLDPGIEIPDEATAIHGITTEHARERGVSAPLGLESILGALDGYQAPLVVYNAPFDLTILDRELRRHSLGTLPPRSPIIDPLVIDKHVDRFRRGSRRLADVCALRGIPLGADAHGAEADAIAAGRLAQWMLDQPVIRVALERGATLDAIHNAQVGWFAEQRRSFADYLERKGDPEHERVRASVDWPLIPADADPT